MGNQLSFLLNVSDSYIMKIMNIIVIVGWGGAGISKTLNANKRH